MKPKYALQTAYAVSYDTDEHSIGAAKRCTQSVTSSGNRRCACTYDSRQTPFQTLAPSQQPVFEGTPPDHDFNTVSTQADSAPQSSSASPTATEVNARKGWRQSAGFLKNLPAVNLLAFSHVRIHFLRSRWCGPRKPLHPICTDPLQES